MQLPCNLLHRPKSRTLLEQAIQEPIAFAPNRRRELMRRIRVERLESFLSVEDTCRTPEVPPRHSPEHLKPRNCRLAKEH